MIIVTITKIIISSSKGKCVFSVLSLNVPQDRKRLGPKRSGLARKIRRRRRRRKKRRKKVARRGRRNVEKLIKEKKRKSEKNQTRWKGKIATRIRRKKEEEEEEGNK